MHGKRYKYKRYRRPREGPNMFIRISVTVLIAVIASALIIAVGQNLGDKIPDTDTDAAVTTTDKPQAPENPKFTYKDVPTLKLGDSSTVMLTGPKEFDSLSVNISEDDGSLAYYLGFDDILYNGAVNTSMQKVTKLVNDIKTLYNIDVTLEFSPFKDEKNQSLANSLSKTVLEYFASLEIKSVILIQGDHTFENLKMLKDSAADDLLVGILVNERVIESESLLREYYSAFDFVVADMSEYSIKDSVTTEKAPETSAEPETTAETKETESTEESTEEVPENKGSIRKFLSENALTLRKYSVGLRAKCLSISEIRQFKDICNEFEINSFEIIG